MKKIKYLASATAFALSFALMGCGTVATENNVTENTESLVGETETVSTTETYVSETESSANIAVDESAISTEDDTENNSAKETVITETVMLEENLSSREIIETASPLTETIAYDKNFAESYGYTFSEMHAFMIPTSTVNVRSLPSTNGDIIGSLSTGDIARADGYCNETGWYRIVSSINTYGYVSNKYLKICLPIDDEIYNSIHNGADLSTITNESTTGTYKNSNLEDGFRKDIAQEIWNLVNAERTAAGLSALAWDEETYEFSCQRAQKIVTQFDHTGCQVGCEGENILMNWTTDANTLHMQWHDSKGHHDNYMSTSFDRGACAVYVYDGAVYAVQNFQVPGNMAFDETGAIDYRSLTPYTASNGVIIRIHDCGSIEVYKEENPNATSEMKEIAVNEYFFGLAITDAELNAMRTGSSTPTQTETYEPTPEQANPTQTEPDTWTASNGVTVYVMNGNAYTINDGYSDDDHLNAWLEYTQSH